VEHLKNPTSNKGPAELFTGDVWIDAIAGGVNLVQFSPGARSAWHAHSKGQTLYVTAGRGLVQTRGEDIVEIRPGEMVRTPAEEWHWHGADHDHGMHHISITGDGEATWGEHVTDAEYRRPR
jgi:quercetin dioxygenase-like cupin family protein